MPLIADTVINTASLIGGFIFCIALALQIIKTYKTKLVEDISLGWAVTTFIAILLGFIYGVYWQLYPIYIANGIQAILSFIIICLKLKYGKITYIFRNNSPS